MKNIQKTALGLVFALTVSLPALADYSQFDVVGVLDNSISVRVFSSTDNTNAFSENDNNTSIPSIQFGHVNTSGIPDPNNIGTGIGGIKVNTFGALVSTGAGGSGSIQPAAAPVPNGSQQVAGLFAIEAAGGSIRVQVDSMASSSSNLNVSYTNGDTSTGAAIPPDLVLANASTPLLGAAFPNANIAVLQVGDTAVNIAGTGGRVTSNPVLNGPTNRLGMNIGLLAFNAAGGNTNVSNGSFTGRVKFTATP